jgi:chemotaxis protein MotB
VSVKGQPVIIVKKIKKVHGGHHGGAWKVAYADFVTAMMAFFLVMWLVNQSQEVKAAVSGYFRDPGAFESQGGLGVLPGGNGVDPEAAQQPATDVETAQKVLEDAADKIRQQLDLVPSLASLRDQIELSVTPEGLRIELVDEDQSSFFDSGSPRLSGVADLILAVIAQELAELPNEVVLEGYTDSQPYSSNERYSNWELSADRANAARRVLEDRGFPASRVAGVIGHADRALKFPEQPLDARNRRVSILVKHQGITSTF